MIFPVEHPYFPRTTSDDRLIFSPQQADGHHGLVLINQLVPFDANAATRYAISMYKAPETASRIRRGIEFGISDAANRPVAVAPRHITRARDHMWEDLKENPRDALLFGCAWHDNGPAIVPPFSTLQMTAFADYLQTLEPMDPSQLVDAPLATLPDQARYI